MTIFNLLLLVLVLVFSTESVAAQGSGSSGTMLYDELLLVLQWPPSFCNTNKTCAYPIPDRFTVHGLWLNKNSKSVNCRKPKTRIPLHLQISGDLRKEMEEYWPDLKNQKHPEQFWEDEYAKHGSCFKEFGNHTYYFQTALDIAKDIGDVMTMRLSSGETLKKGQLYCVQDFRSVTISSRELIPQLRPTRPSDSNYPQLLEIVFCTDTNMTLKNCTSKNKANGPLIFPSSSSRLLGYVPYCMMLCIILCMILCCN